MKPYFIELHVFLHVLHIMPKKLSSQKKTLQEKHGILQYISGTQAALKPFSFFTV